jgi:hypothetical protein
MTVANATSEHGFAKLLNDVSLHGGKRSGRLGKFMWLSPEIADQVLSNLGFEVELLDHSSRDLHVVASLVRPEVGAGLEKYIRPRWLRKRPRNS